MIKIIFLTAISWLNPALPKDSLRTETINGKVYVIHQVGEKETLFSISRRYGTALASVVEANPNADSGLEVGQLLKIPYVAKNKPQPQTVAGVHKVQPKETLFSISRAYNISLDELKAWNNLKDNSLTIGQELRVKRPASFPETKSATPTAIVPKGSHMVASSETLFSIARQYNITVDQIKAWNNIQANELKVGQLLTVAAPATAEVTKTDPKVTPTKTTTETRQTPPVTTSPVTKDEPKTAAVPETTIKISESVPGSDEIRESGVAELIEGSDGNRKYLALHKTAKAGTIMKVRNELNNREVFVRVVGPLPEIGANDKLVIKISKSAYDRLGAIEPKFRVEVTYYK